jgi:hypothetical protein
MLLLRALPIRPRSMVWGQIAIPTLVTLVFQWLTILVAALVTRPGWSQVIMWTGMLNALAVFTFAAENAVFLTFPHHQHHQGISMMIRAKLVFFGKMLAIVASIAALLAWLTACRRIVSESICNEVMIVVPIVTTWLIAIGTVAITTWCWKRFDLEKDIPPQ